MLSQILMIYTLFQWFLFFVLKFLSIFWKHPKITDFLELRNPQNWKQSFEDWNPSTDLKTYWIHVSSAGELEQFIPIADALHQKEGAVFFVTYFSKSAEPFLKNFKHKIYARPLPLDCPAFYKMALEKVKISGLFFVRYDIWPGLFLTSYQKGIPTYLTCATQGKTKKSSFSIFSQIYSKWIYKKFHKIFAVEQNDLAYFQSFLPKDCCLLAGDPKWERALERATHKKNYQNDQKFRTFYDEILNSQKKIIIFGSPHFEEQLAALELFPYSHRKNILILFVPHDIKELELKTAFQSFQKICEDVCFYSQWEAKKSIRNVKCCIVDAVGLLAEMYSLGDLAVIGGGFDGQIHNVLEPAANLCTPLFGPRFARAAEAQTLLDHQGALSFPSRKELVNFLCQEIATNYKQVPANKKNLKGIFASIPRTSAVIAAAIAAK